MFQYQSFDDAPGMVNSRAKLDAFRLPPLEGRSFFDVACNEGFYCGVALDAGAARVVGLDAHTGWIEKARTRFPQAEFLCQRWDTLPDEKFDIVLFASALHYIGTVDAIVGHLRRLGTCVAPDGVLIIEAGISPRSEAVLSSHDRADGSTVYYPSMTLMGDMLDLAGFSYRRVGQSEPGDSIPRHVFHCRHRKPSILFVTGASGDGKTTMTMALTGRDHSRHVSVDYVGHELLKSRYDIESSEASRLNGILEVFRREPDSASLTVAKTLKEAVQAQLRKSGRDVILVDGLDLDQPAFRSVYDEFLNLIGNEFVVWTASVTRRSH